MNNFADLLQLAPYSMNQDEKEKLLLSELEQLVAHHRKYCKQYDNLCDALSLKAELASIESIPYLPVRLFKQFSLKSVEDEQLH